MFHVYIDQSKHCQGIIQAISRSTEKKGKVNEEHRHIFTRTNQGAGDFICIDLVIYLG